MQAAWATVSGFLRRVFGKEIKIISPRSGVSLDISAKETEEYVTHDVIGTLKTLPRDHEIWLLVQDVGSRWIWPQRPSPVLYDEVSGQWSGKIGTLRGETAINIIAVVAPPTASQLFRYYEEVGAKHRRYEPLDSVPTECVNIHKRQVKVRVLA